MKRTPKGFYSYKGRLYRNKKVKFAGTVPTVASCRKMQKELKATIKDAEKTLESLKKQLELVSAFTFNFN